jgi:hypothetical protein
VGKCTDELDFTPRNDRGLAGKPEAMPIAPEMTIARSKTILPTHVENVVRKTDA